MAHAFFVELRTTTKFGLGQALRVEGQMRRPSSRRWVREEHRRPQPLERHWPSAKTPPSSTGALSHTGSILGYLNPVGVPNSYLHPLKCLRNLFDIDPRILNLENFTPDLTRPWTKYPTLLPSLWIFLPFWKDPYSSEQPLPNHNSIIDA